MNEARRVLELEHAHRERQLQRRLLATVLIVDDTNSTGADPGRTWGNAFDLNVASVQAAAKEKPKPDRSWSRKARCSKPWR